MTLIDDSVSDFIHFLRAYALNVRDPQELAAKIARIRSAGLEKFQVISDFDKTLTPQWLKDRCSATGALRACQASHGVIETSRVVSSRFQSITKELVKKYMPIEHDYRLSVEERIAAVNEWYKLAHDAMMDEKLTSTKLDEIVHECWSEFRIHLRSKSSEFFGALESAGIPITVLSAGLRDVIERLLKHEKILDHVADANDDETDSLVMVVSNRLRFSPSGDHVGFSEPIIHAFNKRDALHEFLVKSPMRCERPNALVMGDLIADVDFVHSIPNLDEYIAIGFLCDGGPPDRLNDYLKHFDVVIMGGDAGMQVPVELMKALTS